MICKLFLRTHKTSLSLYNHFRSYAAFRCAQPVIWISMMCTCCIIYRINENVNNICIWNINYDAYLIQTNHAYLCGIFNTLRTSCHWPPQWYLCITPQPSLSHRKLHHSCHQPHYAVVNVSTQGEPHAAGPARSWDKSITSGLTPSGVGSKPVGLNRYSPSFQWK